MPVSIAISYHSVNDVEVNKLSDCLKEIRYETFLISESTPDLLLARSKIVQTCSVFLAVVSRNYQSTISCMDLLHYAKDLKKKTIVYNPNESYRPFGALGAIAAASEIGLINVRYGRSAEQCIVEIIDSLTSRIRPASSKEILETKKIVNEASSVSLTDTDVNADVLLLYHDEAKDNVTFICEALGKSEINFVMEDCTLGKTSILTSKVLVVVMSPELENNTFSRVIIETANSRNKPIIPISVSKTYKPNKWLGLVIAGKLYYRLFDREQAYQPQYDTTPMNNFIYAIKAAMTPKPTIEEREKAEIERLSKMIEESKPKLKEWPPKRKEIKKIEREPVKVVLPEPKAELQFNHIHYTVTRMSFNPPQPLFDNYGVPLRHQFDCMISYQWDHQDLVREVYMDLHMKSLKVWFDIWGGMEGNSNEAMATAIESSKVILVFLSDSYQKSVNCKMEFKYAISCGKPIIFIIIEPNLVIEDWIKPYVDEYYKYQIFGVPDLGELHNNVPKIDCIAKAIRLIGNAQPDYNDYDLSEQVFNMRQLLNDALDEISLNTGKERFKTCARCNKQYEEDNPIGCKSHSAYYVGGSIIAGRWVCCSQQDKNSVGCEDANHIDQQRTWTCNRNYGTYTWEPA